MLIKQHLAFASIECGEFQFNLAFDETTQLIQQT